MRLIVFDMILKKPDSVYYPLYFTLIIEREDKIDLGSGIFYELTH